MKTFEENKAVEEARGLNEMLGEDFVVVSDKAKKRKGHIVHLVLGGVAVGATLFLHIPVVTYSLCAVYVVSGVVLLNRFVTG